MRRALRWMALGATALAGLGALVLLIASDMAFRRFEEDHRTEVTLRIASAASAPVILLEVSHYEWRERFTTASRTGVVPAIGPGQPGLLLRIEGRAWSEDMPEVIHVHYWRAEYASAEMGPAAPRVLRIPVHLRPRGTCEVVVLFDDQGATATGCPPRQRDHPMTVPDAPR